MQKLWFKPYVIATRTVMLAGIAGRDDEGNVVDGVVAQTKTILARTESLLGFEGADRSDIARVRVYLVNVEDWPLVKEELQTFFGLPSPPCTAVGNVRLVEPEMLVEIECEASLERDLGTLRVTSRS